MIVPVCQSCGMPMPTEEMRGKEADGSRTDEYCCYCYDNGSFGKPDETMDEMIETCVPYMVEQGMKDAEARQLLQEQLPKLKRWAAK